MFYAQSTGTVIWGRDKKKKKKKAMFWPASGLQRDILIIVDSLHKTTTNLCIRVPHDTNDNNFKTQQHQTQ